MAKTKTARRASGAHRPAAPKARQTLRRIGGHHRKKPQTRQTVRRASGHQHRKKAKVRRTTHRLALGVLEFATHGLWPLGNSDWLRVDEPTQPGWGVFSPMLAALQNHVLARLREIQSRQRPGVTTGHMASKDTFARLMEVRVREAQQRGVSDSIFEQVSAASNICEQILEHLEEDGRWQNVHRCFSCGRWFFAWKHDPRDPQKPYCSKRCWPSTSFRDAVARARRVQSGND